MTIRLILLLSGISALIFTSPNVAAHPPEDMPWQAKQKPDYTVEKTENIADLPKPAEDINVDAKTSDAPASEAISSLPESAIKTDEVEKKGWFARWKEKHEARKAAKIKQDNP